MNLPLDVAVKLAWTQIWQVTAVAIAVGVFTKICCRTRPHLAYALWLLGLSQMPYAAAVEQPDERFQLAHSHKSNDCQRPRDDPGSASDWQRCIRETTVGVAESGP